MTLTIYQQLDQWFHGRLGTQLRAAETQHLESILPNHFGYYAVQLGAPIFTQWLHHSPIKHRLWVGPVCDYPISTLQVRSDCDHLPLAPNSIDLVVMPHVLEFAESPQLILQEAINALIPNGALIILGFNPMSFWGLWRKCQKKRNQVPWQGRYVGITRLRSWLEKDGCTIEDYSTFYFRPPVNNDNLSNKLLFMESFGRIAMPHYGGVFCVVARKQESCITALKTPWRLPRWVSCHRGVTVTSTQEPH
ncbi:MAG: class I SAM-dependent methyltransferase [Gammaproteobacteria bacterium]